MQRTSFDFDVITGPSGPRRAPGSEPKPDGGRQKPAPAGSIGEGHGDPRVKPRSPEDMPSGQPSDVARPLVRRRRSTVRDGG
jgi:hypothetical protein